MTAAPSTRARARETAAAAALGRRLAAVAPYLGAEVAGLRPGAALSALVEAVRADLTDERVWLLHTALTTALPDIESVRRLRRGLAVRRGAEAERWLLERTLFDARFSGAGAVDLVVVDHGVLVDVDFVARYALNTGVQRVARALLPRWHRDHEVVPVAWTNAYGSLRRLDAVEQDRVLHWDGDPSRQNPPASAVPTLVVPWRSVVVLPEVALVPAARRLAAVGAMTGNEVVAIGYDCIPVVSALLLTPVEPERFARYLEAVKHLERLAGISASASAEFSGFTSMLPGQGLPGPQIVTVDLPTAPPDGAPTTDPAPDPDPLVLVVGALDDRKNALAVLYAAEVLWREGLSFRLQFVAGGARVSPAVREVDRLAAAGRRVAVAREVRDADLADLYRRARFTVFVSLHEGYGLPVTESFSYGVPAVVSAHGSLGELAAGGGAIAVDAREDDAVAAGMRRLLTDDAELERLRTEIAARPVRTWDDYAAELWTALVEPGVRG